MNTNEDQSPENLSDNNSKAPRKIEAWASGANVAIATGLGLTAVGAAIYAAHAANKATQQTMAAAKGITLAESENPDQPLAEVAGRVALGGLAVLATGAAVGAATRVFAPKTTKANA